MKPNYERVEIKRLKFDKRNARKHDKKNIKAIKDSLAKFGQQKPIVVIEDGTVIAGNGTLQAAIDLGWDTIDVHWSALKKDEATAYGLVDNRSAELAEWDDENLKASLQKLDEAGWDLEGLGWDNEDLEGILEAPAVEGLTDEDEVPEVEQNVFGVKLGDIWQLGNHRLMCGDSTDKATVEKLMNGEKADITFTSPPYNAGCFGFDDGKSKYKKKGDDDLNQDAYLVFLKSFTDLALDKSKYVFFNNQFLYGNRHALAKFFGHYADMVKDVFPWIKNTAPPNVNKGVFTNRFEFFLCLEKGNSKKGFPVNWQGKFHNVIEGRTASSDNVAKKEHSATMPSYVPEWFFERLSFVKSVYEPFTGTGTTIIACEKTDRKCYGLELDPHYCSVIIQRWQDFTGKEAVKL